QAVGGERIGRLGGKFPLEARAAVAEGGEQRQDGARFVIELPPGHARADLLRQIGACEHYRPAPKIANLPDEQRRITEGRPLAKEEPRCSDLLEGDGATGRPCRQTRSARERRRLLGCRGRPAVTSGVGAAAPPAYDAALCLETRQRTPDRGPRDRIVFHEPRLARQGLPRADAPLGQRLGQHAVEPQISGDSCPFVGFSCHSRKVGAGNLYLLLGRGWRIGGGGKGLQPAGGGGCGSRGTAG